MVLVPKTTHLKEPNHFRPVALTSHLMKTMDRIIHYHFRPLVGRDLDFCHLCTTMRPLPQKMKGGPDRRQKLGTPALAEEEAPGPEAPEKITLRLLCTLYLVLVISVLLRDTT